MQNMKIWLIDEMGKTIAESNINFVPVISVLWKINDSKQTYPFLAGIDPYGLTYFNVHQAPIVIAELEKLNQEEIATTISQEITDTIEFLKKVEQHTFAQFIGD